MFAANIVRMSPTGAVQKASVFETSIDGFTVIGAFALSIFGWLAGLLEGEGSFTSGAPSKPNLPRVSLAMTDLDIVQKVGSLFGVKICKISPRNLRNKPIYRCEVKGSKAVVLMRWIKPLMGARRQTQIERSLASYKPLHKRCLDEDRAIKAQRDLNWLSGVLEGEGSFMKGSPSKPHLPRISLQMTDLDVMQQIGVLFGNQPYLVKRPGRPQRKLIYACALVGSRAVTLMKQLRHFMGMRRQAQIDGALASYKPFKKHDKVYPTRDQLLSHGRCSTNSLAKRYGVSRHYIDKVRGPNIKKDYPTREQLLSHGECSINALARHYGISWQYVNKVRGSLKMLLATP